jgi:hypothetical protein
MSKVLKTGDVKRYPNYDAFGNGGWALVDESYGITCVASSRKEARDYKSSWERIARILSIGPKLVTVRIEK